MKNVGNNWGVDSDNTRQTKDKTNIKNSNPKTWGQITNSYSSGYSGVLKAINVMLAFIVPFIAWGIFAASLSRDSDGLSFLIALIGYVVTATILWVKLSYKAKLFENISKLAQNSEAILYELQNKKGDN